MRHALGLSIIVLWILAVSSPATPIRPDLKQLLSQPQPKKMEYIPARAGWNGPEQQQVTDNPYVQRFGAEATKRAMRASLMAAAVPDWRVVLLLVLAILLLRRLRRASPAGTPASQQEPAFKFPRAA